MLTTEICASYYDALLNCQVKIVQHESNYAPDKLWSNLMPVLDYVGPIRNFDTDHWIPYKNLRNTIFSFHLDKYGSFTRKNEPGRCSTL